MILAHQVLLVEVEKNKIRTNGLPSEATEKRYSKNIHTLPRNKNKVMSPTPPDDNSSRDEDTIREQVLEGLRLALNEELLEGAHDNRRNLTNTEEEKLLYFAIEEFNLPVTYSWYLAGAKSDSWAGSSDSIATTDTPDTTLTPSAANSDRTPVIDDTPSAVEKYRDYFVDTTFFRNYTLKKIVFTDKTKFLCDFYEEFCDEKYTDLYIYSTKLRQKIEEIENLVEDTNQKTTLGKWGAGSTDGVLSRKKEKEFRTLVSNLHFELAQLDGFDECRIPFTEATDEIEIILTKLTHLSSVSPEQKAVIADLEDFYYSTVWKYPALKISAETATGPKEDSIRRKRNAKFNTFHNQVEQATEKLRERRVDAGLSPSSEEFTANEDKEVMNALHIASQAALRGDE